jgi:hypothetical protein
MVNRISGKLSYRQMSFWANVFLGKCRFGKCPFGQTLYKQMSLGKRRMGKCPGTCNYTVKIIFAFRLPEKVRTCHWFHYWALPSRSDMLQ